MGHGGGAVVTGAHAVSGAAGAAQRGEGHSLRLVHRVVDVLVLGSNSHRLAPPREDSLHARNHRPEAEAKGLAQREQRLARHQGRALDHTIEKRRRGQRAQSEARGQIGLLQTRSVEHEPSGVTRGTIGGRHTAKAHRGKGPAPNPLTNCPGIHDGFDDKRHDLETEVRQVPAPTEENEK